jgi:phenylacetate-coenzyme A ligase PaaK-like adenylate-forming protein
VNPDDIVETTPSGTTGNPVVGAYTKNDMEVCRTDGCVALTGRQKIMMGTSPMAAYSRWLRFHYGA